MARARQGAAGDACSGARHLSALIVGSGFSGLAVAIELKRVGIEDFAVLERARAIGGTWRDNDYPGCACDVPSHLYSFSFAPHPGWTRSYAPQAEIRAYLERVADDFDVRRHVLFEQTVVAAAWDESSARWRVHLQSGALLTADALVMALGALSNPAIPRFPGDERFRGVRFHSARWDHGYDLRGKRVAVIGTGASAVQFVPRIQPAVAQLYLLQRTPPWVLPRLDRAFRGWEKAALRWLPGLRWLYRQSIYWRLERRALAFVHHPALMKIALREGERHLARSIRDPALRRRLTPRYQPGCKRLLLSDDYYPALAQPNVEVIDEAVAGLGEHAITLAGGRTIEVDAIIYGTGFAVHDYLGGVAITGRDGVSLSAQWAEDGAQAYLGTMVAGFPNLFLMTGPNTGLGHNSMVVMIEAQARYVREAMGVIHGHGHGHGHGRGQEKACGARSILEPRRDAQDAYSAWIAGRTEATVWRSGCRSWYLDERGRNTTLWPGFATTFCLRLARLRRDELDIRRLVRDRAHEDSSLWRSSSSVSKR